MNDFESRYTRSPMAVRSQVEHAYERSKLKSIDVQFEALADVGDFNSKFPELPPIKTTPYIAPAEPRVRCPNALPSGWR